MMLLSDWYAAKIEKRRQMLREEGKAKGIAEKIVQDIVDKVAEGIAMGKVEERELWIAWNNRRLDAAAKGESFTEPPPNEIEDL